MLDFLAEWARRFAEAGGTRDQPGVDDKVLTDWNGMAIAGLAETGRVLGDAGIVERAARDAARSLGRESVLELDVSDEPVMVWASVAPLELSVGNVVRNAIEASPPEATVRLSITTTGEWAEIRVDDSGPGLPGESETRVFEPFFSTKTDRGGSGLGLAIVKQLVEGWGGRVGAESSSGLTRFWFSLPQRGSSASGVPR